MKRWLPALVAACALTTLCGMGLQAQGPSHTPAQMPAALKQRGPLRVVHGVVGDVVDAGPYVYVDVSGVWVASLKKPLERGAVVDVRVFGDADHFVSHRTGRVFDHVAFGVVTVSSNQESP